MTSQSAPTSDVDTVRYRVTGMDCPDCVAKIEKAVRKVPGVDEARVSLSSQVMTVRLGQGAAPLPELERTVTGLGYRLALLKTPDSRADDDELPADLSHVTPGYKRALWIVVLLNVGYGLVEMVGGFLSDSQALKADALDFAGDGLISFLGLLAIGWHPVWRSRSALIQGLFLGALGIGVLINTAYRVVVQREPEADIMGLFWVHGAVGQRHGGSRASPPSFRRCQCPRGVAVLT